MGFGVSFRLYAEALGKKPKVAFAPVSGGATIDKTAKIGKRTFVCAGAWIGPGVEIGDDCYIGPNAVIGAPGFGFEHLGNDHDWWFREHPFGVVINDKVSVGAGSVIDRGRYRPTWVSAGTKIDAHVFVAHNVQIGLSCLIIANSMLAGSAEIGDYCWIGPSAQVSDHVKVGSRSRLGIGSVALRDVPPEEIWVGAPAKFLRKNASVTSHSAFAKAK